MSKEDVENKLELALEFLVSVRMDIKDSEELDNSIDHLCDFRDMGVEYYGLEYTSSEIDKEIEPFQNISLDTAL